LLINKEYVNMEWYTNNRDRAHGLVKKGDILFVYFTSKALLYKQKIKIIGEVEEINEDHTIMKIKLIGTINGLCLSKIRGMIKNKKFSERLKFCGRQGFNITKLYKKDYIKLLNMMIKYKDKTMVIDYNKIKNDKEYYEKLETISDINLLNCYHDELDDLPKTIKRKLRNAGFIRTKMINSQKKVLLTEKGEKFLKN